MYRRNDVKRVCSARRRGERLRRDGLGVYGGKGGRVSTYIPNRPVTDGFFPLKLQAARRLLRT